jgi:ribosomal protein S18 acetylase RimI-like enzyme
MQLIPRIYQDSRDQQRMMALVRAQPQDHLHNIDLPYRFSSWAFDASDNIRLWEDQHGDLLAWAVLQTPFWAIDYAYHPAAPDTIHSQILAWADAQARQQHNTAYGRPAWFVNVFDWQQQRQRDLEAYGFVSQADQGEDSWTKVLFEHDREHPLPAYPLPTGCSIRPLRGVEEVDAYAALHRAVFESESMTAAWRGRTLRHADYQPDLDLVAVDSDGQLAAFCICWFTPNGIEGRPSGQIEPLGVRADMRRHGLGRTILAEGVRRLYQHGAEHVVVETDNYRNAAFALYTAAGFRVSQNVLVYRKDVDI